MVPLSCAWAMSWVMSKVPSSCVWEEQGWCWGCSFTWSRLLAVAAPWSRCGGVEQEQSIPVEQP